MNQSASTLLLASCVAVAGCAATTRLCTETNDRCEGALDGSVDADAGPCGGTCTGATPHCRASDGVCVACLEDEDCTSAAASRCDAETGTCMPCRETEECTRFAETPVCGRRAGCVVCTPTEPGACGATPCTAQNTCSAYGADRRACESCDTDANCISADHYCVPMRYQGVDRPVGYCLEATEAVCSKPFVIATPVRTSLSGALARTFCGISEDLATCEAVRARLDDWRCSGTDSRCGPSGEPEIDVPGALCRTVGVLTNRCTYACGEASHCPSTAPSNTCGDSNSGAAERQFCGGADY